ncbi:hypothetical protein [Pseudomonas sp. LRF_L74]|uniref:hypothetical protein n=1 Tax=Pseudomonas sp. LRF_L74 TaxID=3369422 RepID=UPI003F60B3DA
MRTFVALLIATFLLTLTGCDGGASAALEAENAKRLQQQEQQLKQQIDQANAVNEQRLKEMDDATK